MFVLFANLYRWWDFLSDERYICCSLDWRIL